MRKITRLLCTAFLLFGLSGSLLGQTTIYSDDFTGEDDKGNVGGTTDLTGVDWSIDTSDGSFTASSDYFAVQSGVFEAQDVDGDVTWTSESINISGYTDLEFSIDLGADGDFEASGDVFKVEIVIDSGTPDSLIEAVVDEGVSGDPMFVGATQLSSTLATFTNTSLGTGSSAVIKVTANNNAGSELYRFDNLILKGTVSGAVINPTNETANIVSTSQIDLSWTDNGDSDNVLLAFNTSNTFGDPVDGTTYAASDDLGGATVLQYSGTDSYSHTGRNANTTYYYKIWSYDGSSYSSGVEFSGTTLKNEPSAHVTGFTATKDGISEIDLSWTDVSSGTLPDNYIIKGSETSLGSISDPVDGTAESDDTDLSDGEGVLNIAQGTQAASFTGLDENTQYFFKIYPYTNSGSNIDYKTDGSIPSDDATTDSFTSSVVISQYVDTESGTTPKGIEVWNVSGSTIDFSTTSLVVNRYANGSTSATEEANISSGTLAADAVMVIGGSDLSTHMSSNFSSVLFINDSFSFNGDDALELVLDGARQDVFGTIGTDPGSDWNGNGVSTADQNIELKLSVNEGTSTGFSDPSTRFQTVSSSPTSTNGLANFGLKPGSFQITGSEGWRILSSPTSDNSYDDLLGDLWTQGIATGADATNGDANVKTYDGSSFNAISDLTATMSTGVGFITYVYSDDDYTNSGTDAGFPKTLSLSGTENSGSVSPTLTSGADAWTLVGNPYASTIDWDDLSKTDLTGTVYVYDHSYGTPSGDDVAASGSAGSYRVWNGTSGSLTDGLIAPLQGFWVQNSASASSEALTIEEADKSSGGTFYKESKNEAISIKLRGEMDNMYSESFLSFTENGELAKDNFDGLKLAPLDFRPYLSVASVTGDTKLDINNLPSSFENELSVPVTVEAFAVDTEQEAWVSRGGEITLSWPAMNNLPDDWSITLNDTKTGAVIDMRNAEQYVFDLDGTQQAKAGPSMTILNPQPPQAERVAKTAEGARFTVTISNNTSVSTEPGDTPEAFTLEQNYPNPFNPTTSIQYSVADAGPVTLTIYNVMGQQVETLVSETKSAGSYRVSWNAANMASGIYYYRLQAGNDILTRQMTLIK